MVLYGDEPGFLRRVRVPGQGWHCEGAAAPYPERTPPKPWPMVGRCWAGVQHPVVDATGHVDPPTAVPRSTEPGRSAAAAPRSGG